ncbi:MAG: hypothetical protein ACI9P8_000022 [Bacteroidia bacterium]|jgi:hypothetical protein
MGRFLFRISVFILATLGLLKVIELAVSDQLRASEEYYYADFERAHNGELKSDIVVLGSSRAFVHYDPAIIEDSTSLSCYNLAIDGGCQSMQFAIWKNLILNNELPKVVVQNVEYLSFGKRKTLFEKERYLPYLHESYFFEPLSLIDTKLWQDRYIPMYRYHGQWKLIKDAIGAFLDHAPRNPYDLYKGHKYKNQDFTGEEKINNFPLDASDFKLGKTLLSELLNDCKLNDVDLVLCYSPEFDNGANAPNHQVNDIVAFYTEVASQHEHVVFWDMRNMDLRADKKFFADNYHLNEQGAKLFSKEFSGRLRQHLNR